MATNNGPSECVHGKPMKGECLYCALSRALHDPDDKEAKRLIQLLARTP